MDTKVGGVIITADFEWKDFKKQLELWEDGWDEIGQKIELTEKTLAKFENRWREFTSGINEGTAALRSATGLLAGITGFFALSIRESQKAAEAQALLRSSVESTGDSVEDGEAQWLKWDKTLNKVIKHLALTTRFTREDVTDGLSRMVAQTGSVETSLGLMTAAMGHAQLSGYGLRNSVRTINQVMQGNVGVLRNWWTEFRDVDALIEQFGSRAEVVEYALGKLQSIKPPKPEGWQLLAAHMKELQITTGNVLGKLFTPWLVLTAQLANALEWLAGTPIGKFVLQLTFIVTSGIAAAAGIGLLISKLLSLGGVLAALILRLALARGAVTLYGVSLKGASSNTLLFAAATKAAGKAIARAWLKVLGIIGIVIAAWEAMWEINQQLGRVMITPTAFLAGTDEGIERARSWLTLSGLLNRGLEKIATSMDDISDEDVAEMMKKMQEQAIKNLDVIQEQTAATTAYDNALRKVRQAENLLHNMELAGIKDSLRWAAARREMAVAEKELAEARRLLIRWTIVGTDEMTGYEQAQEAVRKAMELETKIIKAYTLMSYQAISAITDTDEKKRALVNLEKELIALLKLGAGATTEYGQAVLAVEAAEANLQNIKDASTKSSYELIEATWKLIEARQNLKKTEQDLDRIDVTKRLEATEKMLREFRETRTFGDDFFDQPMVAELVARFEEVVGQLQAMRGQGTLTLDGLNLRMGALINQLADADRVMGRAGKQTRAMLVDQLRYWMEFQDRWENDVIEMMPRAYLGLGRDLLDHTKVIGSLMVGQWQLIFDSMVNMTLQSKQKIISQVENFVMNTENFVLGFIDVVETGFNSLEDALIDSMQGARVELRDIWKGIAADFMKLVVRSITQSIYATLVPAILSLFGFGGSPAAVGAAVISGFSNLGGGQPKEAMPGLNDAQAPGVLLSPGFDVVVHEASPLTWVQISDKYIEPRMRERSRSRTEAG